MHAYFLLRKSHAGLTQVSLLFLGTQIGLYPGNTYSATREESEDFLLTTLNHHLLILSISKFVRF